MKKVKSKKIEASIKFQSAGLRGAKNEVLQNPVLIRLAKRLREKNIIPQTIGCAMKRKIDPHEILVFFRDGRFYSIHAVKGIELKQQAEACALLNPGTTRVEDKDGNVLWVRQ